MGFSNPIIGGGGSLVYPSIHSPNFDVANPTSSPTPSWAILKNGLAYFFGLILQGGTITGPDYIFNSNGLFFYSSTPATGNLIAWFAPASGTDGFGNAFTEGLNVGGAMQNIALIPLQNSAFNVTQSISGILQAVATLGSGDASQIIPGILGSLLLGTGTATKQATVLGSPIGSGTAAYIMLESENDGNTDTSIITIGTAASPDGTTIVYTPIITIGPYYFLIYNGVGGTSVITKTSGSGNISVPASGVSPGKGEAWGAGASTAGVSGGATTALGGNGSGGYSAETTFPITPGGNVAYSVPASANGVGAAPPDCTLNNGLGLIVTAHSGTAGTGASFGAGAAASSNTIARAGANGGARSVHTPNAGGGGGGGGSGPSGQGNPGNGGSPTAGGAGGLGVGGANGGNGGAPNTNGAAGTFPGAGGGGGGSDADGAIGGAGQVRLTFSIGAPGILCSIATAAGTDQFGTAFSAGVHYTLADGNTYRGESKTIFCTANQTISSTSDVVLGTNTTALTCPVAAGSYKITGTIAWAQGSVATAQAIGATGPAVTTCRFTGLHYLAGSGGSNGTVDQSTLSSVATPAFAINSNIWFDFTIIVTFSASGTFSLVGHAPIGADTWVLAEGSHFTIAPIG
jgi:hypothetical protein